MRRARLEQFMKSMDGDGVAILFGGSEVVRNADQHFEFRQDADFHFLTGFDEPDAVAVLTPSSPDRRYTLFVRPRKREEEIWTGVRSGVEGAVKDFGADAAFDIAQLDDELPKLLEGHAKLYYRLGHREAADHRVISILNRLKSHIRSGAEWPSTIVDPGAVLHEMRLRKDDADMANLREATRISAEGHIAAMRACKPGMYEYELEAIVEFVFHRQGAQSPAYPSIVGAGLNSTILHYNTNREQIKDGDLVLIDAGAEYNLLSGDITRTFPANGKFTKAQRAVYEVVLTAQKEVVAMVKPGVGFMELHERAVEVISDGLIELGLLSGSRAEVIEKGDYKQFFMHRTGHWLGMDVHDVGRYRLGEEWRQLEPGMVFTVEPGVYIAEGHEGVPPEFYNIGVRVEDDVHVTQDGVEVLTAAAPKEIADIETTMKENVQVAF